jgi:hypothetical protein
MRRNKWSLVQKASDAKARGDLDDYERLIQEIRAFDAACQHKRYTLAACADVHGDHLQICVSCGKVLSRIPTDQPSGVRIRVQQ